MSRLLKIMQGQAEIGVDPSEIVAYGPEPPDAATANVPVTFVLRGGGTITVAAKFAPQIVAAARQARESAAMEAATRS